MKIKKATKSKSYFSRPVAGLKADLLRHAEEEVELNRLLAKAENPIFARTYRALLEKLAASKAELTTKIGR